MIENSLTKKTMAAAVPRAIQFRLQPFLCAVIGSALLADVAFLMTKRVFHFGVLLPLAMSVILLMLSLKWTQFHSWLKIRPPWALAWRWLWFGAALWLITLAAFWIVLARVPAASAAVVSQPPAAILVLGSGTLGGKVSPVLAARLDLALRQARLYPSALVVVSGGVDFGQTISEGQVMGDYLRAHGLAGSRIVQEEKSTSTNENLAFSKPLLRQRGVAANSAIELITSDFHTLRASWIARHSGFSNVTALGAKTPLYVRFNAWLREYFAVVKGFMLREFV